MLLMLWDSEPQDAKQGVRTTGHLTTTFLITFSIILLGQITFLHSVFSVFHCNHVPTINTREHTEDLSAGLIILDCRVLFYGHQY